MGDVLLLYYNIQYIRIIILARAFFDARSKFLSNSPFVSTPLNRIMPCSKY